MIGTWQMGRLMNDNGQLPSGEESVASMAMEPANTSSASIESVESGDGPVTSFSFPWLDGQGEIQIIQAFVCQ